MPDTPATVQQYLARLPADRRGALEAVRKVILKNLDKGYEEGVQYGMIGYFVPHSVYPPGYHCDPKQPLPFAGMASQKNHMSIYLFCLYGSPEEERRFREAWEKSGKKLDMGKSCIRFKKADDLALDVLGPAIKRVTVKKFIEHYEANIRGGSAGAKAKAAAPKKTAKKAAKKPGGKKIAKKAAKKKKTPGR